MGGGLRPEMNITIKLVAILYFISIRDGTVLAMKNLPPVLVP